MNDFLPQFGFNIQDNEYGHLALLARFAQTQTHVYMSSASFPLAVGEHDFLDVVRDIMGTDARILCVPSSCLGVIASSDAFVVLRADRQNQGPPSRYWDDEDPPPLGDKDHRNYYVSVYGARAQVARILGALHARFDHVMQPTVRWCYSQGSRVQVQTVLLPLPKPVHDAYYPFIPGGADAMLDRFVASEATVLFLEGPMGTGKTSLLRHLIYRHRMNAMVTYDEQLLKSDQMFVSFLTGDANLLVVEDADVMLGSREYAGNELMSRFLNVSDGLIKFPNKKLVFTTNLADFSKVDPALLRPGRCFGVAHFRALTLGEGIAAARVAGIAEPTKDVTLAELFNGVQQDDRSARKVGFAA